MTVQQKEVCTIRRSDIYASLTDLRETENIDQVAQMLHSGEWIAICATVTKPVVFCLGRISREQSCQENK